jgi:RsiW-degrading membrane proteinase PrsW (M82 family)
MNFSKYLPLLIAPVIFFILILLARKIMERKVLNLFTSAYFIGLLTAIPMMLALYFVYEYWLSHVQSLRRILFYSFVLIGFLSEFTKFLMLRFYYLPKESFTKPFDGILFSVMIAMGYATTATAYFLYEWKYSDDLQIVLYTLPAASLLIGIIMGFFTGMAKFRTNYFDSLTGLAASFFFYGFYSFCLISQDYVVLGLLGAGIFIISILLAVKSLNTDVNTII